MARVCRPALDAACDAEAERLWLPDLRDAGAFLRRAQAQFEKEIPGLGGADRACGVDSPL
jgi:hypothetical protein